MMVVANIVYFLITRFFISCAYFLKLISGFSNYLKCLFGKHAREYELGPYQQGTKFFKYRWKCPNCGTYCGGVQEITEQQARQMLNEDSDI